MMVPQPNVIIRTLRIILKWLDISCCMENYHYEFHQEAVSPQNNRLLLISGGWHHWKYMEGIESQLRCVFSFKPFTNKKNEIVAHEANESYSVAIHIRRGDYMVGGNYERFGSVCNENYYKKAIKYVELSIENPVFYVFSNDMEWAKTLLQGKSYVCIDWNTKENSWADMALMSKFHHIIIANSTFSWWAAWLGSENKVVICPPYLINNDITSDIFPQNWNHIS